MLKLVIIFAVTVFSINCYGCKTPFNQDGVCTSLQQCPPIYSHVVKYGYTDLFFQLQSACDNFRSGTYQVVCCPIEDKKWKLLTVADGCGLSSNNRRHRIIGGASAYIGAYPWMAILGYGDSDWDEDIDWRCGGSLITDKHVLTAAHCINKNLKIVRLGEHDLTSETETQHIDCNIIKKIRYENYDKMDGHGDLGLLYLNRSIVFTLYIQPICLPISQSIRELDFTGFYSHLAGWGLTSENNSRMANTLQELEVPVLENEVCKSQYRSAHLLKTEKQFDNRTLCAGELSVGKDSCSGDSGGPLMYSIEYEVDRKNRYYQIGIISYGHGCGRGYPGVYVRTSEFLSWIEDKLNE